MARMSKRWRALARAHAPRLRAWAGSWRRREDAPGKGRTVAEGREFAEGAVEERLAVDGDVGGDDGQGGEHGFDEGAGMAFVEGGEDEEIGELEEVGHVGAVAQEADVAGEAETGDLALECEAFGAFAGDEEYAVRHGAQDGGHGADELQLVLGEDEAGNVEQDGRAFGESEAGGADRRRRRGETTGRRPGHGRGR